jgi:hypothetical protein
VVEEGSIVVIEATVRTIPLEAMLGGVSGEVDGYLTRIAEKFGQAGRFIRDLADGRVRLSDVSASTPVEAFPVVVLLHPFPQHYATWEALEAEIHGRRHLDVAGQWIEVRNPQILTAEELEMLEPHVRRGMSISALFREKVESAQWRHRSMKDFLIKWKNLEDRENQQLDALFHDAFDRVRPAMRRHLTVPWDVENDLKRTDSGAGGDEPAAKEGAVVGGETHDR